MWELRRLIKFTVNIKYSPVVCTDLDPTLYLIYNIGIIYAYGFYIYENTNVCVYAVFRGSYFTYDT